MFQRPPIPLYRKAPLWRRLLWPGLAILLVVMVVLAVWAWLVFQGAQSPFTSDVRLLQRTVGHAKLRVPANLIRVPNQRQSGNANRLDLAVLWPGGRGFSEDVAAAFNATHARRQVVRIGISERRIEQDMNARYEPIYRQKVADTTVPGPGDLILQPFEIGHGFDGEVLARSRSQPLWVARCDEPSDDPLAICLRDFHTEPGLEVTYTFPVAMLGEWRSIETMVRDVVDRLKR